MTYNLECTKLRWLSTKLVGVRGYSWVLVGARGCSWVLVGARIKMKIGTLAKLRTENSSMTPVFNIGEVFINYLCVTDGNNLGTSLITKKRIQSAAAPQNLNNNMNIGLHFATYLGNNRISLLMFAFTDHFYKQMKIVSYYT